MDAQFQKARAEVRLARGKVEQVRTKLLCASPRAIAECAKLLTDAVAAMEQVQANLGEGTGGASPGLRTELGQLKRELSRVSLLLQGAGSFYEGYGRLLGSGPMPPEQDYAPVSRRAESRRLFLVHG